MGGPSRQGNVHERGVECGNFLYEGDHIEGMGISTGARLGGYGGYSRISFIYSASIASR